MNERLEVALSELTTLRLGGRARRVLHATSARDIIDAVREVDAAGDRLLVLGGGSNLVPPDEGFPGTVVLIASRGITVKAQDACSGVTVSVAAGEPWEEFVTQAVENGWVGLEALAGIPGLTGATPIQNVGAYGQEVSQRVARVLTWDRQAGAVRTWAGPDCGFDYRHSRFKGSGRWVVLEVTFRLTPGSLGEPVRYRELADRLGVAVGQRAPLGEVRAAVLELRSGKGMVLDAADHDTWSAGSFFTNPVLTDDESRRLPAAAPRFPDPKGRVKTSAAWLIEHAGFPKGYGSGQVRLSTKHALALTNLGGAKTADLLALAREIRAGVRDRFGVELVNEPVLLDATL